MSPKAEVGLVKVKLAVVSAGLHERRTPNLTHNRHDVIRESEKFNGIRDFRKNRQFQGNLVCP